MTEIDISGQIQITNVVQDLLLVLDKLVVHQSTERIAEAVVLSVVNDECHTVAQLHEVADVLRQCNGVGADLDPVTGLQVLQGRWREQFVGLQLVDSVLGRTRGDVEEQLTSLVDVDDALAPLPALVELKLVDGQSVVDLMCKHKARVLHLHLLRHSLLRFRV